MLKFILLPVLAGLVYHGYQVQQFSSQSGWAFMFANVDFPSLFMRTLVKSDAPLPQLNGLVNLAIGGGAGLMVAFAAHAFSRRA